MNRKDIDTAREVLVPIKPYFKGGYRLEYDGKYITLFGKDGRHEGFRYSEEEPVWYEEMVLVALVCEVRMATPAIKEVTESGIIIDLFSNSMHQRKEGKYPPEESKSWSRGV